MVFKESSKGKVLNMRTPPILQKQKEIRYKVHSNQTSHIQKFTFKNKHQG